MMGQEGKWVPGEVLQDPECKQEDQEKSHPDD